MGGLRYTLLIVIVLLQYSMKAESGERSKVRNECMKVNKNVAYTTKTGLLQFI